MARTCGLFSSYSSLYFSPMIEPSVVGDPPIVDYLFITFMAFFSRLAG